MTKQLPEGYKQTPVGVIPEDWEVVKLGDVLNYDQPNNYIVASENYDYSYKTPVLTAGKTFILGYTNETNDIYKEKLPVIIFDDFTTSNHFVDFAFKVKSSAMKILHVQTSNNCNIKYVYEQMQLIKFMLGDEHKRYWISEYSKEKIPFPPIKEQEKIVEILSTWDDAIAKQEELIEQKQQFKKSIMQQIFSQKLRFKDDDGSEYPAWEEKKLGDLFDYKNGGSFEKHVVDNGTYKLITLNSIDITGILKEEHKTVNITDNSLNINDLVMVLSDVAHGHFLGLTDIIDADDYVLNQRMGALKPKVDISVFFVKTFINYSQKYFKLKGQGSSQQNLSKGDIVSFRVNLPCLKEQNKIAEFLTTIDNEITKQNEALSELKLQKKSLMQKLLTGEVRCCV